MGFLQLSTIRFIQIYLAQGIVFLMFIFLIYKCLRKSRKRPIIYFALFYTSIAIGIFLNFIYAPLKDEKLVRLLNFLTNSFIGLGSIFLTVFCLSVYKQNKFGTFKQITIILLFGTLIAFSILIPNAVEVGQATNWIPRWNIYYFLYLLLLTLIFGLIPTIYYSFRLFSTLNDKELKKRWKFFIFSIILYYSATYGIFLSNFLNYPLFRIIIAIITISLCTAGNLMSYYGVIKKL